MEVDPYFILGVTRNSSIDQINSAFRQSARKFHPDRAKPEDREHVTRQFKLLKEAYTTILKDVQSTQQTSNNNKDSYKRYMEREAAAVNTPPQTFNTGNQAVFDHGAFEKKRKATQHPNDFGYETKPRLGATVEDHVDPSQVNWGAKMNEYNSFEYKPSRIIGDKEFNNMDFNRMFEQVREKADNDPSNERGLVTKTRDGFMAANSGMDTGGFASISSWNGLMVVGDNFGESGVGYDTSTFGDYRQSFMGGRNPDGPVDLDEGFKTRMERSGLSHDAMTRQEQERLLRQREMENDQLMNQKYNKSFGEMTGDCLLRESENLHDKLQQDTKFIEQYTDLYPPHMVEAARQGQLETAKDYMKQIDASKPLEDNMRSLGMYSTMRIEDDSLKERRPKRVNYN